MFIEFQTFFKVLNLLNTNIIVVSALRILDFNVLIIVLKGIKEMALYQAFQE